MTIRAGCDLCNLWPRRSFPTEQDFMNFEQLLARVVREGQLIEVADPDPERSFFSAAYACTACGHHWRLVHPDQAFRGSWSPMES